jgi:hypothetical protein
MSDTQSSLVEYYGLIDLSFGKPDWPEGSVALLAVDAISIWHARHYHRPNRTPFIRRVPSRGAPRRRQERFLMLTALQFQFSETTLGKDQSCLELVGDLREKGSYVT